MRKQTISEVMSHLGKLSHKKHKRTKEQLSEWGKLGAEKRRQSYTQPTVDQDKA